MKTLLTGSICLLCCITAGYAQNDQQAVLNAMQKMLAVYNHPAHLRFDMLYRYAPEETPGQYQDSLSGQVKLSGDKSWYSIDNTVSINSGAYMIMLFKDDMIMYIAKPAANTPRQGAGLQWIHALDSLLANNKDIRFEVTDSGEQQIIRMEFPTRQVYKSTTYYIDKRSGYLVKMISIVRSDQLYDPVARPLIEGSPTYAVVETLFSNYRQEPIDPGLFDPARYFRKTGKEYLCSGEYADYKVFLGSPDL